MYDYIQNPLNKKWYKTNSETGMNILHNYLNGGRIRLCRNLRNEHDCNGQLNCYWHEEKCRTGGRRKKQCCICLRKWDGTMDFLKPRKCDYFEKGIGHRICHDCWFRGGWVKEENHHNCPGCEKKLPLWPENETIQEIIDL